MFEAYKIAITVSIVNQASSVLGLLRRDFTTTEAAAAALQRKMADLKLTMGTGLLLGGMGFAGLKIVEDLVKPATEYAHQLNIMNMAGLTHQEVAEAVAAAWKNTRDVITTTATENLKSILDLRNVLGSMEEAKMALPIVTRIQQVMAASSEGGVRKTASDNFAFSMAKALDIVGAASDPARFEREAGEMARVITALQGRVTPQQFQSVFAYARQAKFGLGEEFRYQILPTLMLEYSQGTNSQGGGSRGVGPALAAFARLTQQGYINKKALPELEALGLVNAGTALKTTTTGTTVGAMTGGALAQSNPFLWVQNVLMPAIEKRLGPNATREQVTQEILQITRGNQLASQLIMEFALKSQNFLRDQAIIKGAMPVGQAAASAMANDPNTAFKALEAQWESFKTALGTSIIPILIPALHTLTMTLNDLTKWARENPTGVKVMVDAFTALSASLVFSGVVLTLRAAFMGLSLVLTAGGLGGVAGAIGRVTAGFTALAGPLATIAGILGSLGLMADADINRRYKEHGLVPPTQDLWNRLFGGPTNSGPGKPIVPNSGAPTLAVPPATGGGPDIGLGLTATPSTQTGPSQQDVEHQSSLLQEIRDGISSLGDKIAAFANRPVELDGKKVNKQLFQSKRPTDTGSSFDGRLSPAYPTGSI